MSIYYERRQWEPGEAYYFRSTFDFKDICVVAKVGDRWELRFYKGSTNPGPFFYADFAKAKRQLFRYLAPRVAPAEVATSARPTTPPLLWGSTRCTRAACHATKGGGSRRAVNSGPVYSSQP